MATANPGTPYETDEDTSFFKVTARTETYQDDFAIRLTEPELNAFRVQVIVEVIFNPASRSTNFAYNPERTVYGRVVHGTNDFMVIRDSLIQYPSQRVYEYRNEPLLTRIYLAFLDRLGIKSLQIHASAIVASMVAAGADVSQYNSIIIPANDQSTLELASAKLAELQPGGMPLKFVPVGFQPEETYWKFTTDIPGTWFQVTVKRWDWELPDWMPISQPDPEREDPDPSPDSESPESPSVPTPGAPPAPEEESPIDPRTRPDDYSTAPPFEEEPPEEVFLCRYEVIVTFSTGITPVNTTTGCNFLSVPRAQGVVIGSGPFNRAVVRGVNAQGQEIEESYANGNSVDIITSIMVSNPVRC